MFKYREGHDELYGVVIFGNRVRIEIALLNIYPSIRPTGPFSRVTQMRITAPEIKDPQTRLLQQGIVPIEQPDKNPKCLNLAGSKAFALRLRPCRQRRQTPTAIGRLTLCITVHCDDSALKTRAILSANSQSSSSSMSTTRHAGNSYKYVRGSPPRAISCQTDGPET